MYSLKIISIITSVFIFFVAESQTTGVPFAPDSTRWSEYKMGYFGPVVGYYGGYTHYQILGDTIISGKYFQKVYFTATAQAGFDSTCVGTLYLIYCENSKVYLDTILLYDFNLQEGDSIGIYVQGVSHNGTYYFKADTVDSVYIGDIWRKRIVLVSPGFNFSPVRWVEGIGDIDRGFRPIYGNVELFMEVSGYYRLDCFSEHNLNTYGSYCSFSSSCIITADSEIIALEKISVFPNPVTDILNIEAPQKADIVIINIEGQIIKTISNISGVISLNFSGLTDGVYILKVITDKEIITKKIFKQ